MQKFLAAAVLAMIASGAMASGQTNIAQPKPESQVVPAKTETPLRVAPFTHTNFKECPTASVEAQAGRDVLTTQCL